MATASGQSSDQLFVRQGNKIRGPFSMAVLVSMKARGRLDATMQLSCDRVNWVAARSLPELFGESEGGGTNQLNDSSPVLEMPPTIPALHDLPSEGTGDPSLKCFYSIDGIVHDPVPLAALRQRAASGQLAPTDYVWIEGSPDWVPAISVPALCVPTHRQRTASLFRSNRVLVTCVACMALLLLGLPTWYVFASSRQKQRDTAAQARAEEDLQQRKEAEKKKEIARLERERDRLFAQERSLVGERNQTQMQLETVRLTYTQLRAAQKRDEGVEARMVELGLRLTKLDRELADARSAQAKNQQELERQMSLLQGRLADDEMERQREAQLAHERELTAQHNQLQNKQLEIDLAKIEALKQQNDAQQYQAEIEAKAAKDRSDQEYVGARVGSSKNGFARFLGWSGVIVQKINDSFYRVKIDSANTSDAYEPGKSYEMSKDDFVFLDE